MNKSILTFILLFTCILGALMAWANIWDRVMPSAILPVHPSAMRVALFINGTLGDKSFFDSASRGIKKAQTNLQIEAKIIEGGGDPVRWEDAITDLVDSGEFDVIVVGTFTMVPYVQRLAPHYPNTKFIVFDASVSYESCKCGNVYSILFRQSEAAYLAGVLAARLSQKQIGGLPDHAALGMIGGIPIPVIEDFFVGFTAGAKSVAPKIDLIKQYANSFSDPATGKEMAKAQFAHGAGIIFAVAGATGQGVIEAAVETQRFMIGVDADQVALLGLSNPKASRRIVTSVMKNVDASLFRALELHKRGVLEFGKSESLGLKEKGVGLASNDAVLAEAGEVIVKELNEIEDLIVRGMVSVPSAFNAQVSTIKRGAS